MEPTLENIPVFENECKEAGGSKQEPTCRRHEVANKRLPDTKLQANNLQANNKN